MRQPQFTPALHARLCVGESALLGHGIDDGATLCRQIYVTVRALNPANLQITARLLLRQLDVPACRHVHAPRRHDGKVDCPRAFERDVRALYGRIAARRRAHDAAACADADIRPGIALNKLHIAALRNEVDCPLLRIKCELRCGGCIGCALHERDAVCGACRQIVRVDDAVSAEIAFDPARIRFQIDGIGVVRDVADAAVEDEATVRMHAHVARSIAREEVYADLLVCSDMIGVARPLCRNFVPLMEVNAVLKAFPPPRVNHMRRSVIVVDAFPVFLLPLSIVFGYGRRVRELFAC